RAPAGRRGPRQGPDADSDGGTVGRWGWSLMAERTIEVRDGRFTISLLEGGSGPPLLYLHGTWALDWNPFLERLAARQRVLVPRHPGFGEASGGDELLDLTDLVSFYLDQLDQLELRDLPLIGHGLGGMFAAELAAVQP